MTLKRHDQGAHRFASRGLKLNAIFCNMKAEEIYHKMRAIAEPFHAYDTQLVAIAKWIESEFEYKPNKTTIEENPFRSSTPVVPFSNATDFESWKNSNCNKCLKYENKSSKEGDAACNLAYNLDYGSVVGTIPLLVAKRIGCTYDPLYQTCELSERCNHIVEFDGQPF